MAHHTGYMNRLSVAPPPAAQTSSHTSATTFSPLLWFLPPKEAPDIVFGLSTSYVGTVDKCSPHLRHLVFAFPLPGEVETERRGVSAEFISCV